jgi:NADPH-dependent ferric siderophore reductase
MTGSATTRKRTVRFDLTPRLAEVRRVESIAPTYIRITFGGDQLAGFSSLDAEDHFKLVIPAPGEREPLMPVVGPKGISFPEGAARPVIRDYTPRRFDPAINELVVDFVIHGHGPVSTWAAQAAPGQLAGILGPRGSHVVDGPFDWYLLIGDETVLPAIARRLEEASPEDRFVAFIEVDGAADEQVLETAANAEIRWVHRNGAGPGESTVLEDAIRAFTFPEGEFFTWAGGEATTLRSIRRHLVGERGVSPEWASFSGHWKRGTANHDHHEPIED